MLTESKEQLLVINRGAVALIADLAAVAGPY
jgi:hypothetical protein